MCHDCAGGGPEHLVTLMEGESLMNDGSSLVLFEVFLKLVRDLSKGGTGLDGSLLHTFGTMGMHIVWLSLGETR